MSFQCFQQGSERRSSSEAPDGGNHIDESDDNPTELYFHSSLMSESCVLG